MTSKQLQLNMEEIERHIKASASKTLPDGSSEYVSQGLYDKVFELFCSSKILSRLIRAKK